MTPRRNVMESSKPKYWIDTAVVNTLWGGKNPSRCLFRREILCWGGVGGYYEVEKTNYPLSALGLGNNDRQAHSLSETCETFLWYLVPIEDVSKWRTQQMMPLKCRSYRKTLEFKGSWCWDMTQLRRVWGNLCSLYRGVTHICCIIYQTKSHKKLWQCQPIIWYRKTFKVSAQVLLHFALNGSPRNRGSHKGLHYVTFATEYIESCLSYAIHKITGQSSSVQNFMIIWVLKHIGEAIIGSSVHRYTVAWKYRAIRP